MKKFLPINEIKRIIQIYSSYRIKYIPKIISYSLLEGDSFIDFEFIEGSVIDPKDLPEAFYDLGLMHKQCKREIKDHGFITICHGDFHRNNIIKNNYGIFFVDATYIHEDWNFSDLDYLDLYDLYPVKQYPWFIKDIRCFDSYLEAIDLECDEECKELLKKKMTIEAINKFIQNGVKNEINVDFERKLLTRIDQ